MVSLPEEVSGIEKWITRKNEPSFFLKYRTVVLNHGKFLRTKTIFYSIINVLLAFLTILTSAPMV